MERENRCLAHCHCTRHNRRDFMKKAAFLTAGLSVLGDLAFSHPSFAGSIPVIKPFGPASDYVARIKAAFVRRNEEYGMKWPGAVYDGEAAHKNYSEQLVATAKELGVSLDLRPVPIYSLDEADAWISECKAESADGIMLVVLDRQQHSWPTVQKAQESGIPVVSFSPLGTSFTTNTEPIARKPGCVIYSTNDFSQFAWGMRMLKARARMNRTRCVVIKGTKREVLKLADTGITLQYIPAGTFIDIYNKTPDSSEIQAMADDYLRHAQSITSATRQDVINGIRSYVVAGKILETEQADAISMDCLGALGNLKVSLPCIAWSRMNDDRIPAACEADTGAIAAHVIVQYLFDRPAFQQDPVADTSDDTIIGAHCSCPTLLNGYGNPPEPFELTHHHGNRDAVPKTIWKTGQRITCMDFLPSADPASSHSRMLISAGNVVENMNVPPSGGCVVSVKARFDGGHDVLTFPGFHQLFFYGDYKKQLKEFCQLNGFEAVVV